MKPDDTPYFKLTVGAEEFVYYYRYGLEESVDLWFCQNGSCTYRSYRHLYERRSEDRWRPMQYKILPLEAFNQLKDRLIEVGIESIESCDAHRVIANGGDYIRFKLGNAEEKQYYVFSIHLTDSRHKDIIQILQTFREARFR